MTVTLEEKIDDVEYRTSELEQILGVFIVHTERALTRLEKEMHSFKDEMRGFKDEMRVEMTDFKTEMRAITRDMNKKWGELANKMGTIVEDIVAPSIPAIARDTFKCHEVQDFMVRRWRRQPGHPEKRREFDVLAVCESQVIFVEVKSRPRQAYLEEFAAFVKEGEFFAYFPELEGKKLIPIFGSLYLPEEAVSYLSNNHIYALAMKDDVVQILNAD